MKTKILIVEHYSNNMVTIQQELEKGDVNYVTKTVQTETEYKNAIHTFQPDIILSNHTFPSFDGPAALEIGKKIVPQTPFIFISELINTENANALPVYGSTNFVLKERLFTLTDKINGALHDAELTKLKALLKQSEEQRTTDLVQNESKYHALIESSMDAVLLTLREGRILAANAAACEIFKMTHEEICNRERSDIVDSTDPRLQILLEERHRLGRAKGEITFKRKDGTKFPGEITSVVFTDADGQEKTSMIIQDITERKQAENKQIESLNAVQKTVNHLNDILDSSLDVICSFDKEGRFVTLNAAAKLIWGYEPHELIGKKYIDLVYYEDVEKTLKAETVIKSNDMVTTFENRYIHKNGSIIPITWSFKWNGKTKLFYSTAKNATEKTNLEKAFVIERQRFMDLYTQAPSCMGILKGPDHVYEMVNPLYLQLIRKKDIIGKSLKEVLPELKAQGFFKSLDMVFTTGETFSANEMLIKFDFDGNGKLVDTFLNFICQAHRNNEGNIDGVFFFIIDVTEQVLSRKKIEQSAHRYRSLIEQTGDAFCFIDASMKIIEVNRSGFQKLGYSKAEILQLSIGDFFLEEDLITNPLKIDLLKEGNTVRSERKIKRKDNSLINVELSAKMLNDGNLLLFIRDITEFKKAQQALIESEKKYRQIVETAQEGIWLIDETNKTTFVNTKMGDIIEYTREEMMDKEVYFFMDQKGKQILDSLLLRREEKYSGQSRFKFISKTGKEIWANVAANPIFDETGLYKGSLAMVTDITDRKRAEEKLEQQNLELIKTNSELDRFVYSVSHDLRSPLTSVLGLISFIEEESQETDTLDHVKMIRNSINRLDEFIKNILSYSKNKRTGMEVKKIPVQKTIMEIVEALRSMEEAKGIHFEIEINEKKPFYSNSLRFNTILENLISNAVKYHKKNKTDSSIKIIGQSDHEKLQFSIQDNGIGIDSEYHDKIFDMFFRLTGKTQGSGIGLYIVKETVEKLEGFIQVKSELGIGTTFIITLKNLKP